MECLEGSPGCLRSSRHRFRFNIGFRGNGVDQTHLARLFLSSPGKRLTIRPLPGPLGVRGRFRINVIAQDDWLKHVSNAG